MKITEWQPTLLGVLIDISVSRKLLIVSEISQKSRSHLKILGARRVIWNKLYTQDPQLLDVTLHNHLPQPPDACDLCTISERHCHTGHRHVNDDVLCTSQCVYCWPFMSL
jgi:hypothetical protein